jgi:Trk-type K+ transport system membrane component
VDLSTGFPSQAKSLCGSWSTASKLILCALMLRGRRSELLVAIDRAIRLPSDRTHVKEEEDRELRLGGNRLNDKSEDVRQ